jgi:hypothetical protein
MDDPPPSQPRQNRASRNPFSFLSRKVELLREAAYSDSEESTWRGLLVTMLIILAVLTVIGIIIYKLNFRSVEYVRVDNPTFEDTQQLFRDKGELVDCYVSRSHVPYLEMMSTTPAAVLEQNLELCDHTYPNVFREWSCKAIVYVMFLLHSNSGLTDAKLLTQADFESRNFHSYFLQFSLVDANIAYSNYFRDISLLRDADSTNDNESRNLLEFFDVVVQPLFRQTLAEGKFQQPGLLDYRMYAEKARVRYCAFIQPESAFSMFSFILNTSLSIIGIELFVLAKIYTLLLCVPKLSKKEPAA